MTRTAVADKHFRSSYVQGKVGLRMNSAIQLQSQLPVPDTHSRNSLALIDFKFDVDFA